MKTTEKIILVSGIIFGVIVAKNHWPLFSSIIIFSVIFGLFGIMMYVFETK